MWIEPQKKQFNLHYAIYLNFDSLEIVGATQAHQHQCELNHKKNIQSPLCYLFKFRFTWTCWSQTNSPTSMWIEPQRKNLISTMLSIQISIHLDLLESDKLSNINVNWTTKKRFNLNYAIYSNFDSLEFVGARQTHQHQCELNHKKKRFNLHYAIYSNFDSLGFVGARQTHQYQCEMNHKKKDLISIMLSLQISIHLNLLEPDKLTNINVNWTTKKKIYPPLCYLFKYRFTWICWSQTNSPTSMWIEPQKKRFNLHYAIYSKFYSLGLVGARQTHQRECELNHKKKI